MGLGSLAFAGFVGKAQDAASSPQSKAILTVKAIHQEEDFAASPQRIYDALLDSKQFTALSGFPGAEIHREVGGTFVLFGGHVIGRNLELSPNRLIVQAWRAADWPEGIHSIARFELLPQGPGTRVKFDHTGFPPEKAEALESGWRDHYWTTLRKYLV
ncbi:MAG TPA: SRPBCC domain-containing protein [Candidatus Angelobacter sp.]|nr:SRPBCC domain-containing protein [Candidatus Angelobacter sp.]